jgi:hypothetical protein
LGTVGGEQKDESGAVSMPPGRPANLERLLNMLCRLLCTGAVACFCLAPGVLAHDIPSSATVLMYVKPADGRLTVLVRAPLQTIAEIQFPVRGPGYLDLDGLDIALDEAVRVYFRDSLRLFVDGADLGAPSTTIARVALPSDTSFVSYETALARLSSAPLTNATELFWNQASLDVMLEYAMPLPAGSSDESHGIALISDVHRLASQTFTVLRYLPPNGPERVYNYVGDPGLVHLDPGWWNAVSRFVGLGFVHILDGMDHLLFLLALIIPMRSIRALILIVTSFTIAHTITLIGSALGVTPTALWFPALIETLIALSVFYMACENLFGVRQNTRWMIAFGFGLIHGFGFSFILADRLQFAGGHLISSLLAFNIGVELGQLLVVVLIVPALWVLFRYVFRGIRHERIGIMLLSALVAHTAWHWFIQRGGEFLQYSWQRPVFDAAFFAAATRWAMLLVSSALVLLALHELVTRLRRKTLAKATAGLK